MIFAVLTTASGIAATASTVQPAQYVHQSWTIRDGAPSAVCAIAQASDGYLWLGTGTGLYRFDGVQFARYKSPSGKHLAPGNVTALLTTKDGGLWIGSYDGGSTYLNGKTLQTYMPRDGFPPGWVVNFAEGPSGDVWAATGQGLGRFDGSRWQLVDKAWGYTADRADWVTFDDDGTLWVAAVNRLLYLPRGAKRFAASNVALAPGATLALDGKGTLWVSDRLHGTRPLRGLSAEHPTQDGAEALPVTDRYAALRMTFDRTGGLWATGLGTGVVMHVAHPELVKAGESVTEPLISDLFEAPATLTSDTAIPVTEDREGNLWVGTGLGVDSYHLGQVGTLREFGLNPKPHVSVATDRAGHLWLSNEDAVYRLDGDRFVPMLDSGPDILSIAFSGDDTLWVVGYHDLYRRRDGRLETVPLPDHLYSSRLKFITPGTHGSLWASIDGRGIFRFQDDTWTAWHPGKGHTNENPTAGAVAADGAMWFGYPGSEALFVDARGHETSFDAKRGIDVGTVTTISIGRADVLFGGSAGLARARDGVMTTLTDQDFPAFSGITGIVRDAAGNVWVNTGRGVVKFSAQELELAFADPGYRPSSSPLDFRDGIPGIAREGQPVPSMQADDSGRIWVATNQGMHWIDPVKQRRNENAPPVYIKSVVAGGRAYSPDGEVTLPAGNNALQIDYTALSLTSPSRVNFRYRLAGENKEWVDAGTRRQAYYTNLPPGSYRFSVVASNNDGVWNADGATVAIVISPRFYQTWWFMTLAIVVALATLAILYRNHVRRVARTIRLQADARSDERERIARELHDTLLQAIYGIMLRFEAVMATMSDNDAQKPRIRGALKLANDVIVEGRDRVMDLRANLTSTQRLCSAILDLVGNLEAVSSVAVDKRVHVTDRPLDPGVGDDIVAICREALFNAFRHSQATRISVTISATRRSIRLSITDNGTGMPPQVLDDPTRGGHWGIAGMRERAERIDAHLAITSTSSGTAIGLEVPY